jgi:ribosomal-protein-alanine N-acetyltransferase
MHFETARLRIRDLAATDWEALAKLLADPEVMRYASHGKTFSLAETHELLLHYLEDAKKHPFSICALVDKGNGEMIGYCGLEWHTLDGKELPELVFCLAHEFWGSGLAFEAASAILDTLRQMGIKPLISLIKEDNERSISLAKRLGAKHEGKMRIHNIEKLKYVYQ